MNSPRMKRFGQFLLVIFALVCVLMTAAFAEGDVEHTSFVWGTVASLLPPVAAIVLALITKEVYSSLFLGIIVGCFLYTNGSPIDAFQDFVSRLTSNAGGNMGILMFLVILGTMVARRLQGLWRLGCEPYQDQVRRPVVHLHPGHRAGRGRLLQ